MSKTATGFKSHIYAWSGSYIVISWGKKKKKPTDFFALLYVKLNLNNKHCSKNLIGLCTDILFIPEVMKMANWKWGTKF